MTQRMIEINSPVFVREADLSPGGALEIFPDRRPTAIEIGCGIGDFIVPLARQLPDRNYLAIDIYNKGCFRTCRKVEASGLSNIRVLRMEARYLLYHFVPGGAIDAIYVNCPDPWPKKRHRGRRLVNREFLQQALFSLRPGGTLYFSSDFLDYAEQVVMELQVQPGFRRCHPGPWTEPIPDYPLSKYMRRFLNAGQPLYFIQARKRDDLAPHEVPQPLLRAGFRISQQAVGHD